MKQDDKAIRIIIPGDAIPQLRPRFARRGRFVSTYDPQKCKDYKAYVRILAAQEYKDKPIEGAIAVKIEIYRHVPNSFNKTKMAMALAGALRPTTKPDADNLGKGIIDSCKGLLWRDDAQVVSLLIEKWYSDKARAEIEIKEV